MTFEIPRTGEAVAPKEWAALTGLKVEAVVFIATAGGRQDGLLIRLQLATRSEQGATAKTGATPWIFLPEEDVERLIQELQTKLARGRIQSTTRGPMQ